MTQLLSSCSQPTLIAILLPLRRVCHCPVGKAPWQIKKGLNFFKKWLHFQTTKRQHLPHLVCSPEALSESQPVMLGTELHPDQCTSVSARHCCDSTAGRGHSSSTRPATAGMVAWKKESVALAEELEEVCRNGILFSFCCFSPIVSLFCHSSGFSSSFSNPAASWHHSSTLLSSGSPALCSKMLHEASTAHRGLPESRHNLHAKHT